MIVNANFRDPYKKDFKNGPYTFDCPFECEVGDLVLVQTKHGVSLAQIVQLNATLSEHVKKLYGENIAPVIEVCKTRLPV